MNQKEITRAALLIAAQGDPQKAAEMETYLTVDPQQQYPAGGYTPGPETVRPTIQTDVYPYLAASLRLSTKSTYQAPLRRI